MKKSIWIILLILTGLAFNSAAQAASARAFNCLTGGTTGCVDSVPVANCADNDIGWVTTSGDVGYFYRFEASSTDAENSPYRIRPDDYASAGVWHLFSAFLMHPSATPQQIFRDSDAGDYDDNVYFQADCSATGTGAEDCDMELYAQRAGSAVRYYLIPGDATAAGFIKLCELTANGDNCVTLDVADSLAADYAVVLPSAAGTLFNAHTDVDHDQTTNFAANEHYTEASITHTNIIAGSGADHSYLDQDVTSGSSPTLAGTNFTGIPFAGLTDSANIARLDQAETVAAGWIFSVDWQINDDINTNIGGTAGTRWVRQYDATNDQLELKTSDGGAATTADAMRMIWVDVLGTEMVADQRLWGIVKGAGKTRLFDVDEDGDAWALADFTAGSINSGAGITATTSFIRGTADLDETDLEKIDGITNGTQAANKAVVADANVNTGIVKATELHIGASGSEVQVTSTPAELNLLDGETDLASQAELDAVAALVDTDDEIIAIINASPSTQIGVPAGGTGVGTLTDGGILLGSGTGAVTPMAVLADGEIVVGDGTTDPGAVLPVITEFIPVGWMVADGTTDPGDLTEEDNIAYRDFDPGSTEELEFMWYAPLNLSGSTIKIQVHNIFTSGNSPGDTTGVSWAIAACSITGDESHDCTVGSEINVEDTDLNDHVDSQWDIAYLGSEAVDSPSAANGFVELTPTGLARGELVKITIARDYADTDDDYAEDVGLVGMIIKYKLDFATETY